jgi:hypothetical protein
MRYARSSGVLAVLAIGVLCAPAQAETGAMKPGLWQVTLTNVDRANADAPSPGAGGITQQICITDASTAVFQAQQDRMMFQAKGMADCSFRAQGAPGTLQAGLVCKGFSSRIGFDRTDADHFSINTLIKDERSIGGVKQDPIALKTSYDWIKSDCGNVAAFSSTPVAITADNLSPGAVAEFRTGYMYERGNGVARDYAAAMQHYLTAAAEGNAVAEFRIGYLYEHGWGVPADFAQARAWYAKAEAHGNAQAAMRGENLKAKDGVQ